MSHYAVLVVGENPEKQLEPYCEDIIVPKYEVGIVSDEEKKGMRDYYHSQKPDGGFDKLDFDKLYYFFGKSWNRNRWNKNLDGQWVEYSQYNENSKWDWYVLGGRFSGMIKLKDGAKGQFGSPGAFKNDVGIDSAIKKDIANIDEIRTFAYLVNGLWYERGIAGSFGAVANEKDGKLWEEQQKKLIDWIDEDMKISIYDLHI